MRTKKYVISVLLGLVSVWVLPVFVAHAATVGVDLIPQETEDQLCSGMGDATGEILSCGETSGDITSFTEYDGQFVAPDASGYDEGLTKATSAREFILNVTNFALSFLGLVAIIVIIYGGFLYVTAGGEEEKSGKGKKAVMYAIIGILIVLSSYALVNTLIGEAAGGGEDRGGGIYSTGEGVTGDQVDVYNVNAIAQELQTIATEYVVVFTTYSNVYGYVEEAKSYQAPDIETVENIFSSNEPVDEDSVRQIREYLETINGFANDVQNAVDSYSTTYEVAGNLKAYTEALINLAQPLSNYTGASSYIEKYLASVVPTAQAGEYEYYDYSTFAGYKNDISDFLLNIKSAANTDFNEKMDEYYEKIDGENGFSSLFNTGESLGSSLSSIVSEFNTVGKHFASAGDSRQNDTDGFLANSTLRTVVEDMGTLYVMVKDLQFVTAQIEASVSEGNAPLIMSFNGLGSYDPNDTTIGDTQYHWDLDGDGTYDESKEPQAATVSYQYDEPGTYRVGLRVTSQDSNIAPGQSYISITVYPPKSNIYLRAITNEGDEILLADYAEGVTKKRVTFTQSEGLAGITFSLDGTEDGNGDDTIYHILDCGNEEQIYESEAIIMNGLCTYDQLGTYGLSVEVTDVIGNIDRYMADIIISPYAARAEASTYSAGVKDIIKFTSQSKTDIGSITSEIWTASLNGVETALGQGQEIESPLSSPGLWNVLLSIRNSAGGEDVDTLAIMIESQSPIAKASFERTNLAQPGIVYLDGTDSYDPDEGDMISYLWTPEGTEGTDYVYLNGTNATSEKPIIKFSESGTKKVTLTVSDQYTDEELKKTTTIEKNILVDSVLDIALDVPMGLAYQLDENGEAEVSFKATSEHTIAFEIDYGDGESDADENISTSGKTFTHTYKTAGNYYVELMVYDEEGNENSYTKKIYVGESNSTIAVISMQKNGSDINTTDITGNTRTVFSFDASDSRNSNGGKTGLDYSWDFGDNTRSTEKTASHTYEDVGTYTLKLTVTDSDDPTITSSDTYTITIKEEPPVISNMSYTIGSKSMTTPVELMMNVDAEDPDGSISNYYWYYYDTSNTTEELGAQITEVPSASFVIPTNGSTGEEKKYAFVVEATDLAGNTVSSKDFLSENPTITVKNGENKAPSVNFSVSDTNIMLGDTVNLSSISSDPDGGNMIYMWDLEGDGFSNNEETDSAVYAFTPTSIGCFNINLKVTDDMGQSTVDSKKATKICVESISSPPEAAFTYKVAFGEEGFLAEFTNNSKFDILNGAQPYAYRWDFDSLKDDDGNGNTKDDIESQEKNPTNAYRDIGSYTVILTVYDTAGNSDEVENKITISDTDPPTAAFIYTGNDLKVDFSDNSTTDNEAIDIVSYIWDFDEATDSSGDGDKVNDIDSTEADPEYTYSAYGKYSVRLTILDSMNKEDFVTRIVEVKEPVAEIIGYINPNPAPLPSDGKIHLSGTSGKIDFSYSTNLTSGVGITCWLDKNVYFDTNGDGVKNNDHDYEDRACLSGTWTGVSFDKSWGMTVIMLTVEDTYGNSYQVTKEVVFDADATTTTTTGGANIFPVSGVQGLILIMVAFSFALLGVSIYTVKKID